MPARGRVEIFPGQVTIDTLSKQDTAVVAGPFSVRAMRRVCITESSAIPGTRAPGIIGCDGMHCRKRI